VAKRRTVSGSLLLAASEQWLTMPPYRLWLAPPCTCTLAKTGTLVAGGSRLLRVGRATTDRVALAGDLVAPPVVPATPGTRATQAAVALRWAAGEAAAVPRAPAVGAAALAMAARAAP
jgi:hypothetical protein